MPLFLPVATTLRIGAISWLDMHEHTIHSTGELDPWLLCLVTNSSSKESQTLVHLGAGSPVVYVSPHIITLHLTHFHPKAFANMPVPGAVATHQWLQHQPLKKGRLMNSGQALLPWPSPILLYPPLPPSTLLRRFL